MEIEELDGNSILYNSNEVKLKINNGEFMQLEELTITKEAISWKVNSSILFIPWDKIVVQAIQAEPQRSIYFMIDESWEQEQQNSVLPIQNHNNGNGSHTNKDEEDEDEVEDEEQNITEFWLIPNDADEIDNIYYIMTRSGNSNPDPENESDENEEFFEGEDIEQMNINDDDDERYADAE
ncbi:hypothetical protein PVAND_004989 [Polypedilum vanderplanki]|uniref:Uncharacterized protein n=1 Tax=Polypedilum vanderplanki TaxID=319348 RepID=A0A9J6BZQ8_POLVA|nr:hypothetical protein PVAND_004989 [Polypedilum vanderplanki]